MKKLLSLIIITALSVCGYLKFFNRKPSEPPPPPPAPVKQAPVAPVYQPQPGEYGYLIVKKELVPGTLVPTGRINKMTNTQEMRRINPVHYVVVRDKVTGTERKLEVSERAYNSIRQGEIYKSSEIEKFQP